MKTFALPLVVAALCSGCVDSEFLERSNLLSSQGPHLTEGKVTEYLEGIDTLRKFYTEIGIFRDDKIVYIGIDPKTKQLNDGQQLKQQDIVAFRDAVFAYVDQRCDAYIDAIFWANRTRGGLTSANNAIAGATGAIVGATGGSATALAVLAAAFGLSGNLFDAYYNSVLFGLEPSGIQRLVDQARFRYRTSSQLTDQITSEGKLLEQIQNYIRLCTPANIEFLVNASIDAANVGVVEDLAPPFMLLDSFILNRDGSVVGPDGTRFPPFAKLPDSATFELVPNGKIKIGDDEVNVAGQWTTKPKDGDGAGGKGPTKEQKKATGSTTSPIVTVEKPAQ